MGMLYRHKTTSFSLIVSFKKNIMEFYVHFKFPGMIYYIYISQAQGKKKLYEKLLNCWEFYGKFLLVLIKNWYLELFFLKMQIRGSGSLLKLYGYETVPFLEITQLIFVGIS